MLVHQAACVLLKDVERRLAELSLTSRGYFVLDGIDRDRPPSQQDLARLLGIDPNSMVTTIDELEGAGLVIRRRSPLDRRRYELHLTDAGRRALSAADSAMESAEDVVFASLGPAERDELAALLRPVVPGQ